MWAWALSYVVATGKCILAVQMATLMNLNGVTSESTIVLEIFFWSEYNLQKNSDGSWKKFKNRSSFSIKGIHIWTSTTGWAGWDWSTSNGLEVNYLKILFNFKVCYSIYAPYIWYLEKIVISTFGNVEVRKRKRHVK